MKLIYVVFALILTAVVVLFALSNRQMVEVVLWPLPFAAAVPIYVLTLGMFVIGFFCGGLAAWLRSLGKRAKMAARRAKPLEREVAMLRERLDAADHEGTDATDAPPKAIAASR